MTCLSCNQLQTASLYPTVANDCTSHCLFTYQPPTIGYANDAELHETTLVLLARCQWIACWQQNNARMSTIDVRTSIICALTITAKIHNTIAKHARHDAGRLLMQREDARQRQQPTCWFLVPGSRWLIALARLDNSVVSTGWACQHPHPALINSADAPMTARTFLPVRCYYSLLYCVHFYCLKLLSCSCF